MDRVDNDEIIGKAAEGFAEAVANRDHARAEIFAGAAFEARQLAARGIAVRLRPDQESTDA